MEEYNFACRMQFDIDGVNNIILKFVRFCKFNLVAMRDDKQYLNVHN
jgi:hypothetical protein